MEDKKNGHSDFLRCLWKNTVLPLFPHQGDDNKKEHGWYLLHARCISSHECVPKNSKLLGALGTILHLFLSLFFFPVPNKFVQVRSILTLQIHSAHIPAQSLKRSENGTEGTEQRSFELLLLWWEAPYLGSERNLWTSTEHEAFNDVDRCCWIARVFNLSLYTQAGFNSGVMRYSWYVEKHVMRFLSSQPKGLFAFATHGFTRLWG